MYNVTSVKEAGAIVAALEDIKDAMESGYPEPTSATDGQVLTADGDGGASWENPQGGLPSTAYRSEDDVLSLDTNLNPIWRAPDVPTIQSSDNGKVLKAQYDDKSGTFTYWGEASGGIERWTAQLSNFTVDDKSGIAYISVNNLADYYFSAQVFYTSSDIKYVKSIEVNYDYSNSYITMDSTAYSTLVSGGYTDIEILYIA